MPGVLVTTDTIPGPPSTTAPETGKYMVVGMTERGPVTDLVLCRSLADFTAQLGGPTPFGFVYDDARRFFRAGGSTLLVAREVGAAATSSASVLTDRAAAPLPTLRIVALGPGSWGARVTRQVIAGRTAGTFRIRLVLDGAVSETSDLTTVADAVAALSGSLYVRAVDLASPTAAPLSQPRIDANPVALTGGGDDHASVTLAQLTAALSRFPIGLGAGAVAIPGYPADLVGQALINHTRAQSDTQQATPRVAGFCTAAGTTQADAEALAQLLDGPDNSGGILLWPLVQADGPTAPLVPSEGLWAGLRASAHRRVGPWRVPAGIDYGDPGFITALEFDVGEADANELDAAKVSVWRRLRREASNSFVLYGYRSLSTDEAHFPLLSVRDLINYITVALREDFESVVWSTIDPSALPGQAQARAAGFLDPLVDAKALFPLLDPITGAVVGPAYRVDAGPAINTPAGIGRQEFDLYVGVRPAPTASLVRIRIGTASLQAAV